MRSATQAQRISSAAAEPCATSAWGSLTASALKLPAANIKKPLVPMSSRPAMVVAVAPRPVNHDTVIEFLWMRGSDTCLPSQENYRRAHRPHKERQPGQKIDDPIGRPESVRVADSVRREGCDQDQGRPDPAHQRQPAREDLGRRAE